MLGLVACSAVAMLLTGCGAETYKNDQSGSEESQKKVQSGQPLYTPPAGAPVPGGR